MEIVLRKARQSDKEKVIWVESLSTPNLSYVTYVWETFINDLEGDWSVEEVDGEVVACGKYSILPDGSAWLETLRVIPQRQGIGLGKRLYEHWLKLSEVKGVKTMRMYTGVNNSVSKSLAMRYGLRVAEKFHGTKINCKLVKNKPYEEFEKISEFSETYKLIVPLAEKWGGWMVMNRTFYKWSPALCRWLTEKGMIYKDNLTDSVMIMGARFMENKQLHIGLFDGDPIRCLDFAHIYGSKKGVDTIHCLYPYNLIFIEKSLISYGFELESAPFIVMEVNL